MTVPGDIQRICFNFQSVCNMSCPYCYIPFRRGNVDATLCHSIVDRCAELGVKVLTFGGGDPFAYHFFDELLIRAAKAGIEVHVDTNGISLKENDLPAISRGVSLLGLPLDGAQAGIHDRMRQFPGHYKMVRDRLSMLAGSDIQIKINTVVSKINYLLLQSLCALIAELGAARWSLYQFWPLAGGAANAESYSISSSIFQYYTEKLPDRIGKCIVEKNLVLSRSGTYLFVAHDGTLYTHSASDQNRYITLGSIFDNAKIEEWKRMQIPSVREQAKSRYYSLMPKSKG